MRLRIFDPKLRHERKRYVVQVGLASFSLFLVFIVADFVVAALEAKAVVVAAIASTAFVLFIMPHSDTARPRHVFGGHFIALIVGIGFGWISNTHLGVDSFEASKVVFAAFAAIGVGFSMFLMAATDTEHPPAAGTALGVLGNSATLELMIFVITSVSLLLVIQLIFRKHLHNLY